MPAPESIAGILAEFGPSVFPVFTNALHDRNAYVRYTSILGIETLLNRHVVTQDQVRAVFVNSLKDPSVFVRFHAVTNLAGPGQPRGPDVIAGLSSALGDEGFGSVDPVDQGSMYHLHVRDAAARILGEIGPEAQMAIPGLRKLLRDWDPPARIEAAIALYRIAGETNGISLLAAELEASHDGEICRRILTAFGEMGSAATDPIPD